MPFNRPTLATLRQRVFGYVQARLPGADATLRRAVLRVHADVLAGELWEEYGYLDYIVDQMLPDTATDYLARWMSIYGLAPKGAIAAAGNAVFTGIAGTAIPVGTLVQAPNGGPQYATQTAAALSGGGTVTVAVLATTGGANTNQAAGTALTLASAIAGVDGTATVDVNGLTGGADLESIAAQRARLLLRIRQPPQGGAPMDYVQWALSVAGVTRAWCLPLNLGAGTVGITFAMDARSNPIPLAADVTAVQNYINSVRPVTATPTVFAPTADPINLTVQGLQPNTAPVKAAIAAALAALLQAKASPGAAGGISVYAGGGSIVQPGLVASPGLVAFADLDDAVSQAAGVTYHLLTVPSADHVSPAGTLAVPGTITYT